MARIKIGVFVGSARRDSFSRKTALALSALMPDGFDLEEVKIDALPMFNQDYDDDGQTPEVWTQFRKTAGAFDGYLFVTPEYNRSVPPVLKNALDIGSRPVGQNVWGGKPGMVVSVSPGKIGGFGANHHLRQILATLDVYTMQQPETYLGGADALFDEQGKLNHEAVERFLRGSADAFADWVRRLMR